MITDYVNKTVVVKYGGSAMKDEALKEQVVSDLVQLHKAGVKVVLVHGGGPEISALMIKLNKKPEFYNGLRVTDRETVDIVQMVLCGKVNKTLVKMIEEKGVCAVGLSGIDGKLIEAETLDKKLGYVGKVTKVNIKIVSDMLALGYIPVISTVGCGGEGEVYNINGDTAAARIAGALGAERLVLMTDTPGLLADKDDPDSLIRRITPEETEELKKIGVISGGMIPKTECCAEALSLGVRYAVIIDGRAPHSVLNDLCSDESPGTTITGIK